MFLDGYLISAPPEIDFRECGLVLFPLWCVLTRVAAVIHPVLKVRVDKARQKTVALTTQD